MRRRDRAGDDERGVRAAVAALGRRGRTTRIPDAVRIQGRAYTRHQRAAGPTWPRAARGFGGLAASQTMATSPTWERFWDFTYMPGPLLVTAVLAFADRRRISLLIGGTLVIVVSALIGLGTPLYTRVFYHLPGVNL